MSRYIGGGVYKSVPEAGDDALHDFGEPDEQRFAEFAESVERMVQDAREASEGTVTVELTTRAASMLLRASEAYRANVLTTKDPDVDHMRRAERTLSEALDAWDATHA
jgi:hypothetical protein